VLLCLAALQVAKPVKPRSSTQGHSGAVPQL
jgi:hypothetical protein